MTCEMERRLPVCNEQSFKNWDFFIVDYLKQSLFVSSEIAEKCWKTK